MIKMSVEVIYNLEVGDEFIESHKDSFGWRWVVTNKTMNRCYVDAVDIYNVKGELENLNQPPGSYFSNFEIVTRVEDE